MTAVHTNFSLKDYNSWRIGGAAEYAALPTSIDEVRSALIWAHDRQLPVTVLGGGTNVLVSDSGVSGVVLILKNLSGFSESFVETRTGRDLEIRALAGTSKSELLRIFLRHKLSPALFLAGLPGDLGGGVAMNAGVSEHVRPREFGEIVSAITVMWPSGELEVIPYSQLKWGYRHSNGWQPGVIVEVCIRWPMEIDPMIVEKVRDLNRIRLQKQPLDLPSCGSVFVNPVGGRAAAQLIDQSGLKGYRVGDAQVSTKHANFIVNVGNAKASDITAVIDHVVDVVLVTHGVRLQTEVVRLG